MFRQSETIIIIPFSVKIPIKGIVITINNRINKEKTKIIKERTERDNLMSSAPLGGGPVSAEIETKARLNMDNINVGGVEKKLYRLC